ncbi:MAG: hypothetical protein ACLP62_11870 [Acidimicrobiales bacterium]
MTDSVPATPGGERRIPALMSTAWESATTAADPLEALAATRALSGLLSGWESRLVAEATEAGATWEVVGGAVGISRQAAWERFHHDVKGFRHEAKEGATALRARHRQEAREFRERVKERAKAGRRP